jgi:hypothetical protein
MTGPFTARAAAVLAAARAEAMAQGAPAIAPEHLLLGIVLTAEPLDACDFVMPPPGTRIDDLPAFLRASAGCSPADLACKNLGIDADVVRAVIGGPASPSCGAGSAGEPLFDPASERALTAAAALAEHLGFPDGAEEFILLGLMMEAGTGAARAVQSRGFTRMDMAEMVLMTYGLAPGLPDDDGLWGPYRDPPPAPVA